MISAPPTKTLIPLTISTMVKVFHLRDLFVDSMRGNWIIPTYAEAGDEHENCSHHVEIGDSEVKIGSHHGYMYLQRKVRWRVLSFPPEP
jgi:hypothetical protein